ncbi:hypothetical protein ACFQRL_04820 [Microbacterium fluvii]|uniref:Uncharacterized protein n=1 Tax=Microbacterium fluvii TaxID=415215 RepID=A0ABW2HCY5_9MICO|nr:hypothetical protein [Microbacterium fluvii]MCU4671915.1 hypothetical protein [Microbacterium fluvii]
MRPLRSASLSAGVVALALALAGCASGADSPASGTPTDVALVPPAGEVIGQGTVMDRGGEVEMCLGAVAESYPPQCSGIPLEGWSWEGVDGAESSGETTWGAYAVQGTYDLQTFTVTAAPVLLALYDPMPIDDPTGGVDGQTDAARLADVQTAVTDDLAGLGLVAASTDRGYVWADVVWDDGGLQAWADQTYGDDVVVVRSALHEVG